MIIGTWGSNKNFWGGGRISAVTNATHLNYVTKSANWQKICIKIIYKVTSHIRLMLSFLIILALLNMIRLLNLLG